MYTITPYRIVFIKEEFNEETYRKVVKDNISLSEALKYVKNVILPRIYQVLDHYFMDIKYTADISSPYFIVTVYNKFEIEDEFKIRLEEYECLPI